MLPFSFLHPAPEISSRPRFPAEDKNPNNANADIEARRNEIQQLQAAINQMVAQLAASELDIGRPKRVELLEEAESQN